MNNGSMHIRNGRHWTGRYDIYIIYVIWLTAWVSSITANGSTSFLTPWQGVWWSKPITGRSRHLLRFVTSLSMSRLARNQSLLLACISILYVRNFLLVPFLLLRARPCRILLFLRVFELGITKLIHYFGDNACLLISISLWKKWKACFACLFRKAKKRHFPPKMTSQGRKKGKITITWGNLFV